MLSGDEAAAIRVAVEAAERQSAGELVPVLIEAADDYPEADWRAAAAGALLASVLLAGAHLARGTWGVEAAWLALAPVAGAVAGALAARWAPLRRWLIGAARLDQRVEAGARAAFLRHEVFRTRDRSGILILVALFEHRVQILADEGIHAAVPPAVWAEVARETALGMRDAGPGPALLRAIERCGALLASHGPARRADDRNELPDLPPGAPA